MNYQELEKSLLDILYLRSCGEIDESEKKDSIDMYFNNKTKLYRDIADDLRRCGYIDFTPLEQTGELVGIHLTNDGIREYEKRNNIIS